VTTIPILIISSRHHNISMDAKNTTVGMVVTRMLDVGSREIHVINAIIATHVTHVIMTIITIIGLHTISIPRNRGDINDNGYNRVLISTPNFVNNVSLGFQQVIGILSRFSFTKISTMELIVAVCESLDIRVFVSGVGYVHSISNTYRLLPEAIGIIQMQQYIIHGQKYSTAFDKANRILKNRMTSVHSTEMILRRF
jgi:hypothetical protein